MKFYHYFRADGKLYKSESILKFDKWAEEQNINDWYCVQFPSNKNSAIEV